MRSKEGTLVNILGMIARDVFGATTSTDTASQTTQHARAHRAWMALVASSISSYWLGPLVPFTWFAFILVYEFWLSNLVFKKFLRGQRSMRQLHRNGVIVTALGSSVYVMGWAPAYLTFAPGSAVFATAWACCAMISALIYSRPDRWLLAANVAPPLLMLAIGAFVRYDGIVPFLIVLVVARLTLSTFVGHRDRLLLLTSVALNRRQRKWAEDASAAKSTFLATMSHELRTPLNAIIGYSEILAEELKERGDAIGTDDAERIKRAGRNLLTLINEVLDFSKIEAGRLELRESETDVATLIEQAAEICAPLAASNNTKIQVAIDDSVGPLMLDGDRLRQCVLNLVSNASKFTHDGHVSIRCTVEPARAGEALVVEVRDTGVGISPDQLQTLFQPFVQGDQGPSRSTQGTGLGLVITRKLANLMGGDVTVESVLGEGSCFTLRVTAKRIAADEGFDLGDALANTRAVA
jgi:signal transduction histidine kinase